MGKRLEDSIRENRSIRIGEFVLLNQEDLDRINNAPASKVPAREELDKELKRLRGIWNRNPQTEK